MSEVDRSNCILPELLECVRDSCCYWSDKLEACTRISLRMSEAARKEWRAQRKAEIKRMAEGER